VPDPATQGPPFIQIGTEGGFLPAPVVISAQPVDWNRDMGTFDFSNVDTYSLFLGTAERADVIVDFSQFAGKTLILYNDSPAPVPAGDPRLDYFTDAPDQTDVGGAPSTPAGWGPNTRTIMQIRVAAGVPAAPFNLTALQNAFATTGATPGVFAAGQNQIIVPGDSYNSAYNMTFPPDPYVRIGDNTLTFTPIGATAPVTLGLEPKAIQDEMGEAFDPEYGRMSGKLGLEMPRTVAGAQNFMLYDYTHPPVELIVPSLYGTPIGVLGDGTQIWKITQNGVDTHAMHFHVFEVQLINRVAWDNNIRLPDPNELGWKDTVRVNPLQDTIVALRPIAPILPFQIPNSIRPLAPNEPLGAVLTTGLATFDPSGEPVTIINHLVNFGWEYVWHCHLLAHEENDMMHGIAVGIAPPAPTNLQAVPTTLAVRLTWTDNSLNETGFTIQRAGDAGFTTGLMTFTVGENVTTYLDYSVIGFSTYYYRVMANNVIGDTAVYSAPSIGFPHVSVDSGFTNVAAATTSNIWPFGPDFNGDGQGDILWRYYGAGGSNLVWYIGVTGGALASSQSSLMNKPGGAIQAIDMPLASVPQKILLDPREAGGMFKESALRREFRDAREAGRLLTRTKRESVEMKLPAGERVLTDPREIAGEGRMQTQALTLLGQDMLYAVTNTNWRIAGTGDFNNDGNTDILWRYYGPEGFNAVWYMNGANYIGQDVIMAVTNPSWKIVGTGDFNSDGSPDILWRYSGPEGFNVVWYMNGVNYIGQEMLYAVTNTNWEIAGTGDFNNDGNTDIIWRYYGPEGFNVVWYMNGATYIGQEMLPAETDLNWRIENN
jgi:FtsP/CotA-like multicopper oxidase with cupredoxin domain